mgnify:CR=1 FL=1
MLKTENKCTRNNITKLRSRSGPGQSSKIWTGPVLESELQRKLQRGLGGTLVSLKLDTEVEGLVFYISCVKIIQSKNFNKNVVNERKKLLRPLNNTHIV